MTPSLQSSPQWKHDLICSALSIKKRGHKSASL
jgi:hypothetical protein